MKTLIRRTARRFGIELGRYRPETSDAARLYRMLCRHNVSVVLDVGANRGQYARHLREVGYHGRIVSFEPLTEAHSVLLRASQKDGRWTVAERMAIGDRDGEAEINVSANSMSSSILPMTPTHLKAAPESRYIGREATPLRRLDAIYEEYARVDDNVFLKIDAQGFERQVLDGAAETLPLIRGLQIEMSLMPLYEGQMLMVETLELLDSFGLQLWWLTPCFCDPQTGRVLQADGILWRGL